MRFAGSGIDFKAPTLASAAGSTGAAAAADVVDVGDSFGAQREKAPRYDQLSATVAATQAEIEAAGLAAEASTYGQGLASLSQTKSAALTAQAQIEAAEKEAEANKQGAMIGGVAKIASAGLGLLTSDETIKTDIKRIDSALEKLRNLKPVTFHYKEEFNSSPERMHHGFIAQEFQKVLPDATYFDDSIGKLCIDTGDVIGLLVRANQELEARIGMLEAKQALATV